MSYKQAELGCYEVGYTAGLANRGALLASFDKYAFPKFDLDRMFSI